MGKGSEFGITPPIKGVEEDERLRPQHHWLNCQCPGLCRHPVGIGALVRLIDRWHAIQQKKAKDGLLQ